MPTLPGTPTSGAIASIIKACQRLNPCMELDVDLLAVVRAAQASTKADWDAGTTRTNVTADPNSGALSITQTGTSSIFSQTTAPTVRHAFHDANDGSEEYALDFFFDPNIASGVAIELASIDLYLASFGATGSSLTFDKTGVFRIRLGYYDVDWNLVPIGDPFDIRLKTAVGFTPAGGVYTIDFTSQTQRRFIIHPGFQNTNTGLGYDGTALRNPNIDSKGVCHILNMPRGLSISIEPVGRGFQGAWIGCVANATAAQFDTTQFYRKASNRNCGPYNPTLQPFAANDLTHNPDDRLITGAVPGYGAKTVGNGSWGIARRPTTKQRAQDSGNTWEQPYHNLKAKTFAASGTWVGVLDMGATPTNDVELRLDDWQPTGTSITYSLRGSNTASTGPFTSIGAVVDGQILTGANRYRWYELTATLNAGPGSGTRFATPSLQSWMMVERVALSTYRYLKDFDSTVTADPVTGQSSIGELKLPVMKAGRKDYRDLASQLGSAYAPASLEAHVFARNTRDGTRLFLNAYRLENREPQDGVEEMTFVSGFDRLSVKIPAAVETYRYPLSGQVSATTVALVSGTTYRVTPSTSGSHPFAGQNLVGFRMHGVTGNAAGVDYVIVANNNDHFDINADPNLQTVPVNADTFEIHSDQTTRTGVSYVGQDYAAIYADLLGVQSAVPARYRGILPATTGRTGTYTLPSDGVKALDILQDVALHADGILAWEKGRIDFADVYSLNKVSVAVWNDRHIVSIETPVGADRRMPSVRVKYGYQADTQKFTNQATYEAFDELTGWGRPNLFDVFEFPDNFCKWNDLAEANYSADKFQRAWKSGVRLWRVKTVLMWPWLKMGDAVTVLTDQYTDRRLSFSADGLTDNGKPIAGKISAVGVIVGKNLWGTDFIVAIRGLDAISGIGQDGTVSTSGMGVVFTPPVAKITPLNTEVDDTVWNLRFDATPGSGGAGANITYDIRTKVGQAAESSIASGDGTTLPRDASIARNARGDTSVRLITTDLITGLASIATFLVPHNDILPKNMGADVENMVVNGGGQSGTLGVSTQALGWSLSGGNALGIDDSLFLFGDRALTIYNPALADSASGQNFNLVDGAVYELSGWFRVSSLVAGTGLGAFLNMNIASGITSFTIFEKITQYDPNVSEPDIGIPASVGTQDWTFCRCIFRVNGTGVATLFAQLGYAGTVSGQAWFDGVKLARVHRATNDGGWRAFQSHNGSGRITRAWAMDDGSFALRATLNDGSTAVSDAFRNQGSMLPASMSNQPFSYTSGGIAAGRMWIAFSWGGITLYRPDYTTVSIPASSSYATAPSPTVSQVAAGALGARTLFVRIAYMKNNVIVGIGAETSIAISANNVLKITSPASVTGYDKWVPLVGTATNSEYIQAELPFGSDYTESTSGFNSTTTTQFNTNMLNAAVMQALPSVSTSFFFYPYYDVSFGFIAFPSRGASAISEVDASAQMGDGRLPLTKNTGMSATTSSAGGSGSGTPTQGGGRWA